MRVCLINNMNIKIGDRMSQISHLNEDHDDRLERAEKKLVGDGSGKGGGECLDRWCPFPR